MIILFSLDFSVSGEVSKGFTLFLYAELNSPSNKTANKIFQSL